VPTSWSMSVNAPSTTIRRTTTCILDERRRALTISNVLRINLEHCLACVMRRILDDSRSKPKRRSPTAWAVRKPSSLPGLEKHEAWGTRLGNLNVLPQRLTPLLILEPEFFSLIETVSEKTSRRLGRIASTTHCVSAHQKLSCGGKIVEGSGLRFCSGAGKAALEANFAVTRSWLRFRWVSQVSQIAKPAAPAADSLPGSTARTRRPGLRGYCEAWDPGFHNRSVLIQS
jgi:hypothetical protein